MDRDLKSCNFDSESSKLFSVFIVICIVLDVRIVEMKMLNLVGKKQEQEDLQRVESKN